MNRWIVLLMGIALLLAACGGKNAEPTPPAAISSPVAQAAAPSPAATSTPRPAPTPTLTVVSAALPSPSAASVPTATSEPVASSSPTAPPRPTTAPAPTVSPTPEQTTLYVATEGFAELNLRARPDPKSRVLLTAPYRSAVVAIGKPLKGSDGNDWTRVRYQSKTGYVLTSLLSKQRPRPEPITLYVSTDGFVGVKLRSRPSTGSVTVAVVPYGASVEADPTPVQGAEGSQWHRVRYQSTEGYISAALLSREKPKPKPTPPPAEAEQPAPSVGLPVRLIINTEAVRVNAPIEYVGLTRDNAMEAPKGWWNGGWYRLGPRPGQPGNAVIAGHLDSDTGPAVFWDLGKMNTGDVVTVVDDRGQNIRFRVTRKSVYYADSAPLEQIFGPSQRSHLNLITCDGYFNPSAGVYDRRLIVFTDRIDG